MERRIDNTMSQTTKKHFLVKIIRVSCAGCIYGRPTQMSTWQVSRSRSRLSDRHSEDRVSVNLGSAPCCHPSRPRRRLAALGCCHQHLAGGWMHPVEQVIAD